MNSQSRWLALSLVLVACGGGGGEGSPDGGADGGLPPAICNAGTRWQPGTLIYEEVTEAWGLAGIEVRGTRLSVTDFDGDGWADLFVRNGGGPDDFTEVGPRTSWLLRNTGAGFEDATQSSGIRSNRAGDEDVGRAGEVLATADVDNDGDLDIFTAAPAGQEMGEVMENDGTGLFSLGPNSGDARVTPSPAGVSFVDYDRDGFVDLWISENAVSNWPAQDHLFRGDGTGVFTDVTEPAGLVTIPWTAATFEDMNAGLGHSWGWSSAACDLNDDGWPDLLASSYGRAPNLLWQGSASGTFANRSVASGYAYDEKEDWTDNESARCYCKLFPSSDGCGGVPAPVVRCDGPGDILRWSHDSDREPWRLGGNSGATVCADLNNDGAIDLLTGEIAHWDVGANSDQAEIMFNTGEEDIRFERPGNDVTGLTRSYPEPLDVYGWNEGIMTSAVFDFDNDGWQDVYLGDSDYPGDRGLLYHHDSEELFVQVETDDFFEHNRSHGVVSADFDRDGDLDLVVGHSRARCDADLPNDCYETQQVRAFENLLGDESNWIQLKLEGGPNTNRAAIGARVSVTANGVTQTQEVDGGHGHFNTQRDLILHFGLGEACEADVTIRWPDADLTTESMMLPSGYRFHVVQGEAPVVAE